MKLLSSTKRTFFELFPAYLRWAWGSFDLGPRPLKPKIRRKRCGWGIFRALELNQNRKREISVCKLLCFRYIYLSINSLKASCTDNELGKNFSVIRRESWLVDCRVKTNCPLVRPGAIGGMPSVGLLKDLIIPYLREFRRKPRKTPNS